MTLSRELGIFRDTIGYFVFVMNKEALREKDETIDEAFSDYAIKEKRVLEMQGRIGKIPSYFTALFTYEQTDDHYSFIGEMVSRYSMQSLEDMLSFWEKQESVIESLIDYYCPNVKPVTKNRMMERDVESWFTEVENAEISDRVKLGLLYICCNYESVEQEFQRLFTRVYREIKALHARSAQMIDDTYEKFCSKEIQKRIYKALILSESEERNDTVCISLLYPYAITVSGHSDSYVLIGDQFERCLIFLEGMDNGNNYVDFALACGSKTRMDILDRLSEDREKTMSQMARVLNLQLPVVIRHMNALEEAKIIYRSRREGRNIYYAINKDTIKNVSQSAERYFKKLMKG